MTISRTPSPVGPATVSLNPPLLRPSDNRDFDSARVRTATGFPGASPDAKPLAPREQSRDALAHDKSVYDEAADKILRSSDIPAELKTARLDALADREVEEINRADKAT